MLGTHYGPCGGARDPLLPDSADGLTGMGRRSGKVATGGLVIWGPRCSLEGRPKGRTARHDGSRTGNARRDAGPRCSIFGNPPREAGDSLLGTVLPRGPSDPPWRKEQHSWADRLHARRATQVRRLTGRSLCDLGLQRTVRGGGRYTWFPHRVAQHRRSTWRAQAEG